MSREEAVLTQIKSMKQTREFRAICELLDIRREKFRDKLETEEDPVARGQARECKKLLELLSE